MSEGNARCDRIKHTPGPWRLGRTGGVIVAGEEPDEDYDGTDFDIPDGESARRFYGGDLIAESIAERGDLSLIAAAPDLLAAAKANLAVWEKLQAHFGRDAAKYGFDLEDSENVAMLRAAIAKAEGDN